MRQHAYPAFDVLAGYGDDFFADAMKLQIDARIAHRQIADAERLGAIGQQRPLDGSMCTSLRLPSIRTPRRECNSMKNCTGGGGVMPSRRMRCRIES